MNFFNKLKTAFKDATSKPVKPYSDQGINQQENLLQFLESTGLQQDYVQDHRDDLEMSKKINGVFNKNGINP